MNTLRPLPAVLAVLFLCLAMSSEPCLGEGLGKKAKPLEYQIFGLTLESGPKVFRETLKRSHYLHTKTQTLYGLEVLCFTSAKRNRLFSNAYVASCPATGQTVGVYVYGEDGPAILQLARERFGVGGNDVTDMPANTAIGGPMRVGKKYRKDYVNVTVSFYHNSPYASYTLALESRQGLDLCARQNSADAEAGAKLQRRIDDMARRAQIVD